MVGAAGGGEVSPREQIVLSFSRPFHSTGGCTGATIYATMYDHMLQEGSLVMKMFTPALVLGWFLFLACSSVLAQGGIYKWTDAKGRVHFSNAPTGTAESVDEALPPASTFATQPELTSPATAATAPASQAASPPVTTEEAPPLTNPPAATEPAPTDEPGLSAEEPPTAPVPSAVADRPGPDDSAAE
jgi:uncharacterized protein DUF4124